MTPRTAQTLGERIQDRTTTLVLDGAMGSEILRRGVPTPLPLWTAPANVEHAAIVQQIHADYVSAGADLITTNTFRTSWYAMKRTTFCDQWETWNRQAVRLARRAAGDRAWVLGSVTTLEDCYRPDLVPDYSKCRHAHTRQIDLLTRLGVDGILLETFNTLRELDIAYTAARKHDRPVITSVVLKDGASLYDGTPLGEVVRWAERNQPDVFMLNCASPETTDQALHFLAKRLDLPLGAYANVGQPGGEMGFEFTHAYSVDNYTQWVLRWLLLGIRVVGGCCGTSPAYIRSIGRRQSNRTVR